MQRLRGRLREVFAYKNRTTVGLFQEEVRAHLIKDNLLHTISNLRLVQFHVVTKVLRIF